MAVNKKMLSSHVPHIFLCFMAILWVSNPFSHPSTSYGRLQLRHQAPLLRVTNEFPTECENPHILICIGCWILSPPLSNNENFGIISSVLMWDSACSCIESLSQINFAPSACPSRDKDQQSLWDLRSPICVWQVQYPSRKWPNPWQFSRRPETWVCHHFQWP